MNPYLNIDSLCHEMTAHILLRGMRNSMSIRMFVMNQHQIDRNLSILDGTNLNQVFFKLLWPNLYILCCVCNPAFGSGNFGGESIYQLTHGISMEFPNAGVQMDIVHYAVENMFRLILQRINQVLEMSSTGRGVRGVPSYPYVFDGARPDSSWPGTARDEFDTQHLSWREVLE